MLLQLPDQDEKFKLCQKIESMKCILSLLQPDVEVKLEHSSIFANVTSTSDPDTMTLEEAL